MQKSNIKHNRRTFYQLPYRIAASETAELFVVTDTQKKIVTNTKKHTGANDALKESARLNATWGKNIQRFAENLFAYMC